MSNRKARMEKTVKDRKHDDHFYDSLRRSKTDTKKNNNTYRDLRDFEISFHRNDFIRDPRSWKCAIKSKREDRRKIDLVRHLFQSYPVPPFLEDVWIDHNETNGIDWYKWYLSVAQGRSLYKEHAKYLMTKKEVHAYLTKAPKENGRFPNIWWVKAYCLSNNQNFADRIANSKIGGMPVSEFWVSVMNFFFREGMEVSIDDLSDYVDYLSYAKTNIEDFSMKGRTINNLNLLRDRWHVEMSVTRTGGYKQWDGIDKPDKTYIRKKDQFDEIEIKFTQIKNSKDLLNEGRAMRSCVFHYMRQCISGSSSIWSMSIEQFEQRKRNLTIEVSGGVVVQVRRVMNKSPTSGDMGWISRWARDMGFLVSRGRYG